MHDNFMSLFFTSSESSMKKQTVILGFLFCLLSQLSFSSKLCGIISGQTTWQGGVFSVIQDNGQTIATTPYILTGNQGCTNSFPPGNYIVRFNGVSDPSKITSTGNIYGCITEPYVFEDVVLNIVFNQGTPPFNGNSFCFPELS